MTTLSVRPMSLVSATRNRRAQRWPCVSSIEQLPLPLQTAEYLLCCTLVVDSAALMDLLLLISGHGRSQI